MTEKKEELIVYDGLEKSLIESNANFSDFTHALDLFSEEAESKKPSNHRSYVYALCEKVGDSLIPFYIGEGKGLRVLSHELEAKDQIKLLEEELTKEDRLEELEDKKLDLKEKIKKINDNKTKNE